MLISALLNHTNAERKLQMNNSYWRLTFFWEYENFWFIIVIKNVFEYQQFRVTLILRECFEANISAFELYTVWENALKKISVLLNYTHSERMPLNLVSAILTYTHTERECLEVNISHFDFYMHSRRMPWPEYHHFWPILMQKESDLKWM